MHIAGKVDIADRKIDVAGNFQQRLDPEFAALVSQSSGDAGDDSRAVAVDRDIAAEGDLLVARMLAGDGASKDIDPIAPGDARVDPRDRLVCRDGDKAMTIVVADRAVGRRGGLF